MPTTFFFCISNTFESNRHSIDLDRTLNTCQVAHQSRLNTDPGNDPYHLRHKNWLWMIPLSRTFVIFGKEKEKGKKKVMRFKKM